MTDDTTNRGPQDRARVAGDEDYEVRYFAEKHNITAEQVKQLIEQHGNNRDELEVAARQLKS